MMNNDELREQAVKEWIETHTIGDVSPHDGAVMVFKEGLDAGLATATAKIEALEAKLAAAEKSNEWLRQCLAEIRTFALDGGHWAIGNACDDALATGAGSLEALEKENADA
jgi:transposase-like protein